MARCKNGDSCVQGKELVVLHEYVEMVEAASAPHSNDCIMYMRLSTHSGKRFFDDWESSGVGDSCLNGDRGWLVRRGGGSVEARSYARVTGLVTLGKRQEQQGRGCLTLGAGGIRVRLEGISSAANLNILLLFKWFLTHKMTRDITIVVGEMMQRHEI